MVAPSPSEYFELSSDTPSVSVSPAHREEVGRDPDGAAHVVRHVRLERQERVLGERVAAERVVVVAEDRDGQDHFDRGQAGIEEGLAEGLREERPRVGRASGWCRG